MNVEARKQEVNPTMKVCDKRGRARRPERVKPRMTHYGGSKLKTTRSKPRNIESRTAYKLRGTPGALTEFRWIMRCGFTYLPFIPLGGGFQPWSPLQTSKRFVQYHKIAKESHCISLHYLFCLFYFFCRQSSNKLWLFQNGVNVEQTVTMILYNWLLSQKNSLLPLIVSIHQGVWSVFV